MPSVFANRNSNGDFIINEIEANTAAGMNIYIASAFFTEANVIKRLVAKDCTVQMVVRLGFPTNPLALQAALEFPKQVQLRYFTGHRFHPKLYIFGDEIALVGSANLTNTALRDNQEVMVGIPSDDERFAELRIVFDEYWGQADVLKQPVLDAYKAYFAEFAKHDAAKDAVAARLLNELGDTSPANTTRIGEPQRDDRATYIAEYFKIYQETVAAFDIVRDAYASSGYRKVDADHLPLRIEIDSFISFVRERVATGMSWSTAPLRARAEQIPVINAQIAEWKKQSWHHLEETIVNQNYPRLMQVARSPKAIREASDDELFDALATLHSFYDRLRFAKGGLPTWKATFRTYNDPTRTRESLVYLIHGPGDVVERMADLIYTPAYKLNGFGRSGVQELVGWTNTEDLPILNARTTKVLRFFGSNVRQVD